MGGCKNFESFLKNLSERLDGCLSFLSFLYYLFSRRFDNSSRNPSKAEGKKQPVSSEKSVVSVKVEEISENILKELELDDSWCAVGTPNEFPGHSDIMESPKQPAEEDPKGPDNVFPLSEQSDDVSA